MYKGYLLHSKIGPKKHNGTPGTLLLVCLAFFYSFHSGLYASTPISLEKIQQMEQKSQGDIKKRFRAWGNLIKTLENESIDIKLEKVNSFFNQFGYESDMQSEGIEDYWKSPDEFIIDGGGDCEDYAIIKYFTLITLGVPTERLRITYVTSLKLNQAHMVLSYYPSPEAEPLILDSLEPEILRASKRTDLKPIYSFNGEGLWLAKQRGQGSFMGQSKGLGKWDELIKRMQ
ncbi:transglutaminase-like cysteine peptidase [Legionella bononiensis]|uniref:Transglutaminase-like cysteine peptidase n=1 Tax=Legionella bononiensis TaxID=2793102 RepID=A0ABS1W845_9GAMM|nr:transglutaminase-like cysteine peptidase [Legionella bononiensis]MBL7479952.1 transglutaminase-like cysteine peptidase [Legionella bononiensis]MBL7525533.1 transglutaminase-like cysteine peptidase [Legionella bononiensis]MBL7561717.1 transglutaminase-like cysteine peptidase [Legionella bononiensis]